MTPTKLTMINTYVPQCFCTIILATAFVCTRKPIPGFLFLPDGEPVNKKHEHECKIIKETPSNHDVVTAPLHLVILMDEQCPPYRYSCVRPVLNSEPAAKKRGKYGEVHVLREEKTNKKTSTTIIRLFRFTPGPRRRDVSLSLTGTTALPTWKLLGMRPAR